MYLERLDVMVSKYLNEFEWDKVESVISTYKTTVGVFQNLIDRVDMMKDVLEFENTITSDPLCFAFVASGSRENIQSFLLEK